MWGPCMGIVDNSWSSLLCLMKYNNLNRKTPLFAIFAFNNITYNSQIRKNGSKQLEDVRENLASMATVDIDNSHLSMLKLTAHKWPYDGFLPVWQVIFWTKLALLPNQCLRTDLSENSIKTWQFLSRKSENYLSFVKQRSFCCAIPSPQTTRNIEIQSLPGTFKHYTYLS